MYSTPSLCRPDGVRHVSVLVLTYGRLTDLGGIPSRFSVAGAFLELSHSASHQHVLGLVSDREIP